jgi:hypothetical protein
MWNSWFARLLVLELHSAFTEVRAIGEDLNARRRKGEQPENKSFQWALRRWHKAIVALSDCLGSRASIAMLADLPPLIASQRDGQEADLALSNFNHSGSAIELNQVAAPLDLMRLWSRRFPPLPYLLQPFGEGDCRSTYEFLVGIELASRSTSTLV